jgi:hypothetical protein
MERRAIAISLLALAGCSFVDDFDKFRVVDDGEDAAQRDAAGDATGETRNDASAPRDAALDSAMNDGGPFAMIDSSIADAEVVDSFVPPLVCGDTVCDDGDPCTSDQCVGMQCTNTLIDGDRDGYAPVLCKTGSTVRGGDCNDNDKSVNPGATELCDDLDNDCNSIEDDGFAKVQCFPDLDRDEYANLDGVSIATCGSCPPLTVAVSDATDRTKHDCLDEGADADLVHPGQKEHQGQGYRLPNQSGGDRSFDYDCNGVEEGLLKKLEPDCGGLGLLGLTCNGSVQGFVDEAPKCGESGTFRICGMNDLLTCGIDSIAKQLCR